MSVISDDTLESQWAADVQSIGVLMRCCVLGSFFSRSVFFFDWIFPDGPNVGVLASLMQCLRPHCWDGWQSAAR